MSLNSYRYRNGLPLATEVASIRPVSFVKASLATGYNQWFTDATTETQSARRTHRGLDYSITHMKQRGAKKGLRVEARLDERDYETGKKIPDEDMARLKIIFHELYPNWNYSIELRVNWPRSRIIE